MSARASFGRTLLYGVISGGSAALLLAVLVLAGRALGDEAYGRFSFALALATISEALMDFGLHQVTVRVIARDPARAGLVFRNNLAIKIVPSLLAAVAVVTAAHILRADRDVHTAALLLALATVTRNYIVSVRGLLQGLEQFGWDAAVVLTDRITLLACAAWVLARHPSPPALAAAFLAARGATMIAALVVARTRVGRAMPAFDPDLWRELPRMALPLGGFLLVLNLYSYVDTVMLGVLATDAETGLYNFAYRIYEGLAYVPAVISTLIAPRLAREYVVHAGRYARLARQALAAGAALAAAAVVSIWLGGRWAVAFLFGPGFAGAVPMLWMLAGGLLFVFPIWSLHAVAISADRERVLLRTTAVGVGLNVAANAVLIPRAGGTGAAAATVLAEAVTAALLFWQLRAPLGVAPDAGASGA